MRKFAYKITTSGRWFLLCSHKPDFAARAFNGLFTHSTLVFMASSRFFHGSTIFANLEGAPSIFQALDIFGGGTCLAKSHKILPKKKKRRENRPLSSS